MTTVYGRVHWERLLQNVRQARYNEALRIVSDRHAAAQAMRPFCSWPKTSIRPALFPVIGCPQRTVGYLSSRCLWNRRVDAANNSMELSEATVRA
jgi:hypothetical protein